jgi:DNA-binding transcriptional LysR family regulator
MIDTKRLQYFIAVAEELHVGRAADRMGIAQPPLSRHIQTMEQDLGAQLFHRGRNAISLTQAGERFYQRVTEILGYLEDAEIEARRIAQGAEGRLRIGFVGSATYGILPSIIKSYRQHFPNVALSLYPMNNAALRRGLIRHEIDIGVARHRPVGRQ